MLLEVTAYRTEALGNDSATTFSSTFPLLDVKHLRVYHVASDGVGTLLAQDTDYSVTLQSSNKASVTFPLAESSFSTLASGEKLVMLRQVPRTQLLDLKNYGRLNVELVENALTQLTMGLLELDERFARTVTWPETATPLDTDADAFLENIQAERSKAETAATNAQTAESGAQAAETNAQGHESQAQSWAEHPEDTEVETGAYSALHHAAKSAAAQTAAETARDKAQDWAEQNEDVEVEPGAYSSRHWAQKAQDVAASSHVHPKSTPRQAILTCPVDANGLPDFLSDNAGDLEIQASASAPLALSFAEGFGQDGPLDGYLRLTAPLTVPASALTNDTRNYVFINGDGTAGVTLTAPIYGTARVNTDQVPVMSANSQAGVTVTASSSRTPLTPPHGAFDSIGGNDEGATYWNASTTKNEWLQVAFPGATTINGYTIRSKDDGGNLSRLPHGFDFEGSDDGANWTTLDSQTSVVWESGGEKQFNLSSPARYKYYRLYVYTENGSGDYIQVPEMQLLGSEDFFDLVRMEMRDSADVVVPRIYVGYCDVDVSGNITGTYSYAPGTFAVRAVNGGANIGTNQRHEEENPFGHGMPIHAVAQIKPEGDEWGHGGFVYNSGGFGVLGQPYAGDIVVQTGNSSLNSGSKNDGNPFLNAGNESSAPCRIKVWRAF
ncbi:discoidin domain-containing protein [Desulfohalovibrio reitneri]|uniref:discoidin domain-containing protein n=1 Tax=Desulfohalovibrio reitneri TaxID=1307759 RepID=UPI0004A6EC9D|nr:discoidin domain-containing protein [Desulfohalovibrio reitneri]